MRRRWLLFGIGSAILGVALFLSTRREEVKSTGYPPPRYPPAFLEKASQDQVRALAKRAVRGVEGETPLGKVRSGEKVLLEIQEGQDMRFLEAIIDAYRERGVEAHYVLSHDLVREALGISKEQAETERIVPLRETGPGLRLPRDGYVEALQFPGLLPDKLLEERIDLKKKGLRVAEDEATQGYGIRAHRKAIRKYITELHPEYDAFFGGRPLRIYMANEVGPKWRGYFQYHDTASNESLLTGRFPSDTWRLIIERTVEMVPWVKEARITDPQGTDLRFSLTPAEAELWSKGSYHVGQVYLYPFQGTRLLYVTEGFKGQVVPKAEGLVAGTSNHNGYYPLIKVYVKDGKAERIEGGGRFGQIWRDILSYDKVANLRYPYLPAPGFFYVAEGISGTNPRGFRNYYEEGGGAGELTRAGSFRFGFGVGNLAPEAEEYAEKHDVPNTHGFHVHQYFLTYDVTTRGIEKHIKIIDKGNLTALDDPEVRALASRYGKADDLLTLDWIPAIPGINVEGDFMKDYGRDPLAYVRREAEEVRNQTYRYLVRRPTE